MLPGRLRRSGPLRRKRLPFPYTTVLALLSSSARRPEARYIADAGSAFAIPAPVAGAVDLAAK
jgi:hypothetical protein